jgi:hypothetical protein
MANAKWTQGGDPKNSDCSLVTMRIPGRRYEPQTLSGEAALDRIHSFCHGFLSGAGGSDDMNHMLDAEERGDLLDLRERSTVMPYAINLRGWSFAMCRELDLETRSFAYVLSARMVPSRKTVDLDWEILRQALAILGATQSTEVFSAGEDAAAPRMWSWEETQKPS